MGQWLASRRASRDLVPIADEAKLPPLSDLAIDRDLECLVVWRDGPTRHGVPTLRRALDADERQMVEKRVTMLRNALAPFDEAHRSVLGRRIAGMLSAFPVTDGVTDDETAVSKIAGYLWVCREQPPWAISRAIELVRSGRSGLNLSYCPSEPEFNALVSRLVAPYVAAEHRTETFLRATIYKSKPVIPLARRLPAPSYDGNHAARAAADLEARKRRRESDGLPEPPEAA